MLRVSVFKVCIILVTSYQFLGQALNSGDDLTFFAYIFCLRRIRTMNHFLFMLKWQCIVIIDTQCIVPGNMIYFLEAAVE